MHCTGDARSGNITSQAFLGCDATSCSVEGLDQPNGSMAAQREASGSDDSLNNSVQDSNDSDQAALEEMEVGMHMGCGRTDWVF